MEQILKENNLLKNYIKTLQNENQAKNKERDLLLKQIEQLTEQINKNARSNVSKQSYSSNQSSNIYEISKLQSIISQQQNQQRMIKKLYETELEQKTKQIKMFGSEVQYLKQQIMSLNVRKNGESTQYYENKLEQLQDKNKKLTLELIRLSQNDYDNNFDKEQNIKEQIRALKKQNAKLKQKQKYGPNNHNNYSQNLQTTQKFKYELQIKQLTSQLNDVNHQNKKLSREHISLQNKIRELENDNIVKSVSIMKMKKQYQLQQSAETNLSIKQKQIHTLTLINNNLKQQIDELNDALQRNQDDHIEMIRKIQEYEDELQAALKYKQNMDIKMMQFNVIINQYNQKIASMQQELEQKNSHNNYDMQMRNLAMYTEQIEQQLNQKRQELNQSMRQIQNLKNQILAQKRKKYLQNPNHHKYALENHQNCIKPELIVKSQPNNQYRNSYQDNFSNKNQTLKNMIGQIKHQIYEAKRQNFSTEKKNLQEPTKKFQPNRTNIININNNDKIMSKIQDNAYNYKNSNLNKKNNMHINVTTTTSKNTENEINTFRQYQLIQKNQRIKPQKEDCFHNSKLENIQHENQQKQKWQELQKKINALKNQNQSLKKSLYD